MKFSKTEINTKTNTAEIWNYTYENGNIIESHKTMSMPIAPWADPYEITGAMITLALAKETW